MTKGDKRQDKGRKDMRKGEREKKNGVTKEGGRKGTKKGKK